MWGSIIGAGVSALGGLYGNRSAAKEAKKSRQWQEYMSSTSHQRAVKDLRAAGLNPILSATKGMTAPMGGGATAQQQNPLKDTVSSAKELEMMQSQIDLLQAQAARELSQAKVNQNTSNITSPLSTLQSNLNKNVVEPFFNSAKDLGKDIGSKAYEFIQHGTARAAENRAKFGSDKPLELTITGKKPKGKSLAELREYWKEKKRKAY